MSLSPYQKRLLWLLSTFGKKYPRQVSDTVQMLLLVEPTLRYGGVRVDWYLAKNHPNIKNQWVSQSQADPVAFLTAYINGVESPTRSPFDRWGRWLFDEVKRAYRARPKALSLKEELKFRSSLSGLLNPFKAPRASGRTTYSHEDIRKGFRTPRRVTRTQLAVQKKLASLWRELPGIREWIAVTGANLNGRSVAQAARAAARWHQVAVDAAMTEAQRRAGLTGGVTVGQLSEGWSLVQLFTPDELAAEGKTLNHCVGGYHRRVSDGKTKIFSLRDKSNTPRATFELVPPGGDVPERTLPRVEGVITQAKGPRNSDIGFASGNRPRNNNAPLKQLERYADLQVLAIALQAMAQHPEWEWRNAKDMHGVVALERALIKEEKKKVLPGTGRRSVLVPQSRTIPTPPIRRTVGLSHRDAAKLVARSKRPHLGVPMPGGLRLFREIRYGSPDWADGPLHFSHSLIDEDTEPTVVFAIRSKKPQEWWGRTGKTERKQRRGYMSSVYEFQHFSLPTDWPLVEIWPDRWVIRGRAGLLRSSKSSGTSGSAHGFPGSQYTPLTMIRPGQQFFESDVRPPVGQVGPPPTRLIAVSRQKDLKPRVAGAYRSPDWAFWELRVGSAGSQGQRGYERPLDDCDVVAITVNRYGVPTAVRCEEHPYAVAGAKTWDSYWSRPHAIDL